MATAVKVADRAVAVGQAVALVTADHNLLVALVMLVHIHPLKVLRVAQMLLQQNIRLVVVAVQAKLDKLVQVHQYLHRVVAVMVRQTQYRVHL